ncbi:hypothetical protein ACFL1B_02910 [Nanoarchaeota archaeon]
MKKGAINLSINMIIVLILAIIILGFALSFITGMFRRVETGFGESFPEATIEPTINNPIGIGSEFYIKGGEERKLTVRILNTKGDPVAVRPPNPTTGAGASPIFVCSPGVGAPTVINAETLQIESGEIATAKIVVKGAGDMADGDICTVRLAAVPPGMSPLDDLTQSIFLNTR